MGEQSGDADSRISPLRKACLGSYGALGCRHACILEGRLAAELLQPHVNVRLNPMRHCCDELARPQRRNKASELTEVAVQRVGHLHSLQVSTDTRLSNRLDAAEGNGALHSTCVR